MVLDRHETKRNFVSNFVSRWKRIGETPSAAVLQDVTSAQAEPYTVFHDVNWLQERPA